MHLIQNFFDFSRSIRTSDFEPYRSILFKISSIFFVFNQPNYSRWTIKFHDNLLKFENKYPNFKREFMNGCFKNFDSDHLFNMATGKAADIKTEEFLLNILENGNNSRSKFVEECAIDITRFEKPIKKIQIKTFANEGVKYTLRQKNSICELKLERDLFSRMLLLSIDNKIDLELVLSYPLTPDK